MTPTHLVGVLKRARFWSSRGFQEGLEADGEEEGARGRENWELDKQFNSCSTYPQTDSEKKWFYLFVVSFHISSQQHSSISVISQGVQACLAIHSAELYFNTRMEGGQIADVNSDLCPALPRHGHHPAPWCPHADSHSKPYHLLSDSCDHVLVRVGSV